MIELENPGVQEMIKAREKIQATVSNVVLEDGKYVGHIGGKPVTKQTTHSKALAKLMKYIKGQS